MTQDAFGWLQNWFALQANGEWHEENGITIESASNPGWRVAIDLAGSPLADAVLEVFETNRGAWDCSLQD